VSLSLWVDPKKGLAQIPELVALRREFESEGLRVGTVKLFLDGVIEGKTAALLAPYVGSRDFAGDLNFPPDALAELATALDAEGFQIHMHAIGDWAIRVGLDALEAARDVNGLHDGRHHLAHIQLFDPLDIPRFRELDVTANFQPLWAFADTYITELTEPVLGPERSRWLYPIGSVVASGADFAFGSDWSVSSMNPLPGIEVGVTRRDPETGPGPSWIPEERVDLATMLRGYTLGSARLNFLDGETGSIEVGKAADLVVLERDLFEIPAHEIGETAAVMTVVGGKVIYRRR
jgi:predicted amidohydrolase YtcJ